MKSSVLYVRLCVAVCLTFCSLSGVFAGTLRVVAYNIAADVDGYTVARPGLDTVLEAVGQQNVNGIVQPADVIALEETTSNATTVLPLADTLNTYYGTTLYAASPYQATESGNNPRVGNGPNSVLYNTQTLTLLEGVGVGTPKGATNGEYRQVARYEFMPVGGSTTSAFYVYVSHMKSSAGGTTAAVQAARAQEAQIIRNDAATLPTDAAVLYMGDFNLDGSTEAAYQTLTAVGTAQGVDPFNTAPQDNTETWATAAYAPIATESATALHYRDDIQFISANVYNGTISGGLRYLAGSYRTFGNNGTTGYKKSVDATTNTALDNLVGPISASTALIALTTASDHLPIVADYAIDLDPVPVSPPVLTADTTAGGQVGVAFTFQITATNSPAAFDAIGLLAGLSVDTTSGLISGTPTEAGTFTVTLNATNTGGTGTATLTLSIAAAPGSTAPAITSAGTATGQQGQAFAYQVTATNHPRSFDASGLPEGLSILTSTGLISGTPMVAGLFTVSISATSPGGTGSTPLTLVINPAIPVINTGEATGQTGVAFRYQITAANSPTSFDALDLPAGLQVDTATGLITGTPTTAGSYSVNLIALNAGGEDKEFVTFTIAQGLPVVTLLATTPTVTAGTGEIGVFTVSLSPPQDHNVIVNLTIKGSAVNGGDYALLKTTKKFKPGRVSKPIKIILLGEGAGPGVKRVVTLVLAPGEGYTVGTAGKVKVKIIGE